MTSSAVEAVLQTGHVETRYVRAGSGTPILLLFASGDPLGHALFERLAARYRVVAPVVPDGVGGLGGSSLGGGAGGGSGGASMPLSKWLRELVDGLGVVRPIVVACESLAGALLGFSLVDPGRIGGVVAVCRDDADPASSVGMLHAAHGLLVVAVDTASDVAVSAETAVGEIVAFVEGEARAV